MSEVIYKYNVPVDDAPHAVGFYPVHVACQTDDYEVVQVWSLCDSGETTERMVQVFGTGQPIPVGASYVGTALAAKGALVWHVFDVTEVKSG